VQPTSATTPAEPADDDPTFWRAGRLTQAGAGECLRRLASGPALEAGLDAALPDGLRARDLLEQRRDGVVGSADERERLTHLEREAYGPGATSGADERLSRLQTTLRQNGRALDAAVRAAGILSVATAAGPGPAHGATFGAGAPGSRQGSGSAVTVEGSTSEQLAPTEPLSGPTSAAANAAAAPARARRRLWVGMVVLAGIAVAAASVLVVGALTPRPSLEIFARPAALPDGPSAALVLDITSEGQAGEGPIRYVGDIGEASFFVTLVRDTFHNPVDPQEGVCLVGHFGDEAGGTVSVNCVTRTEFDQQGVTQPLTLTPSGDYAGINVDVDGASSGAAWGPTGGLQEIGVQELRERTPADIGG
jgi:hypothetical protein